MRTCIAVIIALLAVGGMEAQSPTRTKLMLELELSKPQEPAAKTRPLTLAEATKYMRENPGKPVLVRVGDLDCRPLCDRVRESMPACHADEMWGDKSPRMLLMSGDPVDPTSVRIFREWKGMIPPIDEVKREAKGAEEWAAKAAKERKIELAPPPREIPPQLDWRVMMPVPMRVVPDPCVT